MSPSSQDGTVSASWEEPPRTLERRGQPLSSSTQHGTLPRREHPDPSGLGPSLGPGLAPLRSIRSRPRSVRLPAKVSLVPPIPHRLRSLSHSASIPAFAPSSPRAVLRSLQAILERNDMQVGEWVDAQDVLERWAIYRCLQSPTALEGTTGRTFGSSVSVAVKCASMSTVLGGFQHSIPWVVYECVEELNRTGIYQPGLFRAVPHRSRLEKLISEFDCALRSSEPYPDFESLRPPCPPTASSARTSLRKESTADVCALLKSYLDSLPEPLLHENITTALHHLCVIPSDKRELEKSEGNRYFRLPPSISHRASTALTHSRTSSNPESPKSLPPLMTHSERRSADLSLENSQIHIAQHLLHLTAPPHCSLFVYLCGFFTQLPLSPDNGISLEDVSRLFGRSLASGPASIRNAVLMWLLEQWPRVADGLFDICSAADSEEDEVMATPVYLPFSLALGPPASTDGPAQSPDSTSGPHLPYPVQPTFKLSIAKVRRRGSLISLDDAESVFTASTAESDDGIHGEWDEPFSGHPTLNGAVENDVVVLGPSAQVVHSPGSSSQALPKLDTDGGLPSIVDCKSSALRPPTVTQASATPPSILIQPPPAPSSIETSSSFTGIA